jgi:hypothetical protein
METFYGLNVAKTGTGKVYLGSDVRVTGPDHGRLILNSTSSVDGHSGGIRPGTYRIILNP